MVAITDIQTKADMQQRNHLGTVSRKTSGEGFKLEWELKLVLLDLNFAINFDAAPNYKYVFDPRAVLHKNMELNLFYVPSSCI